MKEWREKNKESVSLYNKNYNEIKEKNIENKELQRSEYKKLNEFIFHSLYYHIINQPYIATPSSNYSHCFS